MSIQEKIKKNIEWFYNHENTTWIKQYLPMILRILLNSATGKPWHNGLIMSVLLSGGQNNNMTTSLFYSCLCQYGYGKHTTVFAAKMVSNLIYGGKFVSDKNTTEDYENAKEAKNKGVTYELKPIQYWFGDLMAAIIIDSSNLMLSHTGFYTVLGDSFIRQSFVSFLSRAIIGTAVGAAVSEEGLNEKVLLDGFYTSLEDVVTPVEGASPIIHVLPKSIYAWLHDTAVAFTESGLDLSA